MDVNPSSSSFTPIVSYLRQGFEERLLSNLESRKSVIRAFRTMLEENEDSFVAAISEDFCRVTRNRIIDLCSLNRLQFRWTLH
ncbi:hypothetical protein CSKR_108501 [Clonorchis sinensis]|uniref:Uncharacterized protein n=1 Tax=Clonorchis sinensis TaxID=79923 RepID=A0A419QHN4_CLOSI|nr:hypothetical protein CSKR_108501 [Clonorchis sinensis]